MKKYILVVMGLLFCFQLLWSQKRTQQTVHKQGVEDTLLKQVDVVEGRLFMQVKGYKNKMALRWAVDNPAIWPFLQLSGFYIDYAVLDKNNNTMSNNWVRLTEDPVKPWTRAQFQEEGVLSEDDDNLLIAAQALYGQMGVGAAVNPTDKESIQQADMAFNNLFVLAMLAADFSPKAAEALGLYYSYPLEVDKDRKYAYRLYAAQEHPVFKVDTSYYVYAGFALDAVVAPDFVQAKADDEVIKVYWPKNNAFNTFTSYNVERSCDSVYYQRLNVKPLVFDRSDSTQTDFVFADSVANYQKYYYRVNGVDAFGDTSFYSVPVSAMARNTAAPTSPFLRANLNFTKDKVELNWSTVETDRPLRGFIVRRGRERSALNEAVHPDILTSTTRKMEDTPKQLAEGLYYQVIGIDTSGNYAFSNIAYVFAFDSIPPKAPVGLKGQIDTTGRVKLSWDMDYGDNVYAYRVFASNHPDNSFSPVTAALVQDTVFVDSISFDLSNRYIYYKVVALDGSNNHSEMSATLQVLRPKMIASPAPVIHSFKVSDKKVSFKFDVYPDEETRHILVYRKLALAGEDGWALLDSLPAWSDSYQDSTVVTGQRYQYRVRSQDIFQMLSTASFPLEVLAYHVSKQSDDINFQVKKEDKNAIKLSWNTPKEKVRYYILYKDLGSGMEQFKSLEPAERTLIVHDKEVLRYGIKVIYEDRDVDSPLIIRDM